MTIQIRFPERQFSKTQNFPTFFILKFSLEYHIPEFVFPTDNFLEYKVSWIGKRGEGFSLTQIDRSMWKIRQQVDFCILWCLHFDARSKDFGCTSMSGVSYSSSCKILISQNQLYQISKFRNEISSFRLFPSWQVSLKIDILAQLFIADKFYTYYLQTLFKLSWHNFGILLILW